MRKSVESVLREGAEHCWGGSGDHIVAIHNFLRRGGKSQSLSSAIDINFMLKMGHRAQHLASIKGKVEARKPKRVGPSMDLYTAASQAVVALEAMLVASARLADEVSQ